MRGGRGVEAGWVERVGPAGGRGWGQMGIRGQGQMEQGVGAR